MSAPRVVLLRGTAANPWELQPWEHLHRSGRADVRLVVPPDNLYSVSGLDLPMTDVRTTGGLMPPGSPGRALLKVVGQRHLGLADALREADIVHAAELGYWFSWQAARLKARLGYRLALTVWETLPFADAYRNVRTRRYRQEVLAATDLFLPVTERARAALALEGASDASMRVCPPGIDVERFGSAPPGQVTEAPLILSLGRLVWEKGHQDVLRALALVHRRGRRDVRARIVGVGPEEKRLRAVARDLGVTHATEFLGSIPHDEVPSVFADSTCLVLASLPVPYWEEQFGMVLAEAMAARLPIVAAASGAIPEVLDGNGTLFRPGDWEGLAQILSVGPLVWPRGTRAPASPALLERYSASAAADRLATAYATLMAHDR